MKEKMAIIEKKVKRCKCERCGYEWTPNNPDDLPIKCANPDCNSPYWNKKKVRE